MADSICVRFFLLFGLIGTMGFLTGAQEALLNITESGNEAFNASQEQLAQTTQQRAQFEAQQQQFAPFIAGLALSLFVYIGLIPTVFIAKTRTKVIGVILIALGVLTTAITNGRGVIPFALLLPAGIIALRHNKNSNKS